MLVLGYVQTMDGTRVVIKHSLVCNVMFELATRFRSMYIHMMIRDIFSVIMHV